jgi:uncharacterized DUF497 family protein
MRFTWDPAKNRLNARRHAIIFEDAVRIFDGQTVEEVDDRFDYGEVRVYAIGVTNGTELTVIYTDRENETRHIISARRSTRSERHAFWQALEGQGD